MSHFPLSWSKKKIPLSFDERLSSLVRQEAGNRRVLYLQSRCPNKGPKFIIIEASLVEPFRSRGLAFGKL